MYVESMGILGYVPEHSQPHQYWQPRVKKLSALFFDMCLMYQIKEARRRRDNGRKALHTNLRTQDCRIAWKCILLTAGFNELNILYYTTQYSNIHEKHIQDTVSHKRFEPVSFLLGKLNSLFQRNMIQIPLPLLETRKISTGRWRYSKIHIRRAEDTVILN